MKRLTLISLFFLFAFLSQAQKNNVVSAYTYLGRGQLDKAKEYIDLAINHEETKTWAKTWHYKGRIYLDILLSDKEKYKVLSTDPLNEAYDAFLVAVKLDEKKEYNDEIKGFLYICGEQFYNQGVKFYQEKKFVESMESFDKTININYLFGVVDTVSMYNAALAAELTKDAENLKKAKKYYEKLASQKYSKVSIYISLATMYKEAGDTLKALKVIQRGRDVAGDNLELLIAETNIYLLTGKIAEAQENLKKALERDPKNADLYFAVGSNYDQFANDMTKTEKERDVAILEAEKAYQKALELRPDFFSAIYNMGILFFNQGVNLNTEAEKIPPDMAKEFDAMKARSLDFFNRSLPFLEQAHTADATDKNTLIALKQLYARLSMTEKYNEINEKLKALGN
ncbi:MAG: hypothetical protein KKA07_08230 [Bacteroidetes bacterium]|nr:hypothetical protein [Bacteroidota bacterium]MBU1719047.1 hypothetical protein [Bacteroidota bacterium]